MELYNNVIVDAEDFRRVNYSISPFDNSYIKKNNQILKQGICNEALLFNYFGNYEFTLNAKEAIFKALSFYNLTSDDEVCIFTTSNSFYISSCVTNEIEKICRWNREITKRTKLIFIIHEFGKQCEVPKKLSNLNFPIIEDYSMCMFPLPHHVTNEKATFQIYSIPKYLPIQYGGILKYNNPNFKPSTKKNKMLSVLCSHYLESTSIKTIVKARTSNYNFYKKELLKLGYTESFKLQKNECPNVFMFDCEDLNLSDLKIFLQKNGIECSIFYKNNSFFLPVNQSLNKDDIKYIVTLIEYFKDGNS